MEEITLYSTTAEMVRVAVSAQHALTITSGTPQFAVSDLEENQPDDNDYVTGTWFSQTQTVENFDGRYARAFTAQVLVSGDPGIGNLKLVPGKYFFWVKVVMDDGQVPVKLAGKVTML